MKSVWWLGMSICLQILVHLANGKRENVEEWKQEGVEVLNSLQSKWLKSSMVVDASCEPCVNRLAPPGEAANVHMYFKKFTKNLVSRQNLKYDKASSTYKRALVFTILPAQLDKLEQSDDPRDVDAVLTEIFKKTQSIHCQSSLADRFSALALLLDIFTDTLYLLAIAEVRFTIIFCAVLLVLRYAKQRYRLSLLGVLLGSLFFSGYYITYLECNKELELHQIAARQPTPEPGIFSIITSFFYTPSDKITKMDIKKASMLNLGFCRPDHVLMMYLNEIFLKQLEFLIESFMTSLSSLQGGLSFPQNIIAPLIMVCLMGYVLKLSFKYILSPRAWLSQLNRGSADRHKLDPVMQGQLLEDRISGANLTLLLTAVSSAKTGTNDNTTLPPAVSGVQELGELICSESSSGATPTASANSSGNSSADLALPKEREICVKCSICSITASDTTTAITEKIT